MSRYSATMAKVQTFVLDPISGPGGRRMILALASAVFARLAQPLLAVLLARRFGAEDYGVFTFAIGAATIASFAATLGWPDVFNRLYPQLVKEAAWGRVKGLRRLIDLMLLAMGLVVCAVLFGLGYFSAELSSGLFYAAILVIPFAFVALRRQQLAGLKLAAAGLMFDQGFASLITFVLVLVLGVEDLATAVAIFILASLVGALLASLLFYSRLPGPSKSAVAQFERAKWFAMALPMTVGIIARQMLNRMDVLMLAPLASVYDVGLYGAAWRLTYLITFPQAALATVIIPLLGEAFAHRQVTRIHNIMRGSLIFAWVTTLPTVAAFVIAPAWVMKTAFGEEFSEASTTLVLLGISQFVVAFCASKSALLVMGGREKVLGTINASVVVANIALNAIFIPLYGRDGAAGVTLVSSCMLLGLQHYHAVKLQRSLGQPSASDA